MKEYLSTSTEETAKIAHDFARSLSFGEHQGARVVGLYGELGSGKTTFMKYVAEALGVIETVQSPTFVIMKIYKTSPSSIFSHLIHIDAYRIEKEEEMVHLGWYEITALPKNLICVEWPERIEGIMPPHNKVFFEHVNENERKIKIQ